MVARDEGSRHLCAIAIPAGNVEVCKVITYSMPFFRLHYLYNTLLMYRLLIALGLFLAGQVKFLVATYLADKRVLH